MSFDIPGFTISRDAVADLSASQYKFVKVVGDVLTAVTTDLDDVIGVLQNTPNKAGTGVYTAASGAAGSVMVDGISHVVATAAIASGVPVTIDATGGVVIAAVGDKVVGVTQSATSGANDLVAVLIAPLGAVDAPLA